MQKPIYSPSYKRATVGREPPKNRLSTLRTPVPLAVSLCPSRLILRQFSASLLQPGLLSQLCFPGSGLCKSSISPISRGVQTWARCLLLGELQRRFISRQITFHVSFRSGLQDLPVCVWVAEMLPRSPPQLQLLHVLQRKHS